LKDFKNYKKEQQMKFKLLQDNFQVSCF